MAEWIAVGIAFVLGCWFGMVTLAIFVAGGEK